jgi:hypothetical protein
MNVMSILSDPKDTNELVQSLGWNEDEVRQVLHGFELAELVERRSIACTGKFVVYEPDPNHAQSLRDSLEESDHRYSGKVIRDKLALQLVLKRAIPHTLVFAGDDESACALIKKLLSLDDPNVMRMKRVALTSDGSHRDDWSQRLGFRVDDTLTRPCSAKQLFAALNRLQSVQSEQCYAATADSLGHTEFVTGVSS